MNLITELDELVSALYLCGQEQPNYLLFLSTLAEPSLSVENQVTVLGKLFDEIPPMLHRISPYELNTLVSHIPNDAVTMRMLMGLRNIVSLFQTMTYLQILHLSNHVIPPGSQTQQEEYLVHVQNHLRGWNVETLKHHHVEIGNTSLQFERKKLLEMEPNLPWELLQLFVELLKLPLEELFHLARWLGLLDRERLGPLIHILKLDPFLILEFKRRFTLPSTLLSHSLNTSIGSPAASPLSPVQDDLFLTTLPPPFETPDDFVLPLPPPLSPPLSLNPSSPQPMDTTMVPSTPSTPSSTLTTIVTPPMQMNDPTALALVSSGEVGLRIARQPPNQTVYQRILKPPPSVMLVGSGVQQGMLSNYFVEVFLVRADSDVELPACLDGTKVERVSNGVFASFKKIKLLFTSQQQGTLFRLKFVLKKYEGNVFKAMPGTVVYSEPIEVFSHTQYLFDRQDAPERATIAEILPPSGVAGTRVVILGGNFVSSPTLRVRFGHPGNEITPTFHERGTLICNVPPRHQGTAASVNVSVSNDNVHFCDTKVTFLYVG